MPLIFADTDLEFASFQKNFKEPLAGGHVSFTGSVRRFNHKKEVQFLYYESHKDLAASQFGDLEAEARKRFSILECLAVHRVGTVRVSEDAVLIRVSAPHRHEAFLAARYLIDELKRTLPIWKKEVYADGSFSWDQDLCHCFLEKHTKTMMQPVKKALVARGVDSAMLEKRVLLVGAGGLGCPMALNLCALGIKELSIYDGDVVSISNLARQFAFKVSELGLNKATLLKRFLEERGFSCSITAHDSFLDEDTLRRIAKDYDLIVDASDCAFTKRMLKMVSFEKMAFLISASVHQQEGEVHVYQPQPDGACLCCYSSENVPKNAANCESSGALTHVCGLVASVASEKALALLSGAHTAQCEVTIIDPLHKSRAFFIPKDRHCKICGFLKASLRPKKSLEHSL